MAGEELDRSCQVGLDLTLSLEEFVGPQHLQHCAQLVAPSSDAGVVKCIAQHTMQGLVMFGRRVQRAPLSSQHLAEFFVPTMARRVGVAEDRSGDRY